MNSEAKLNLIIRRNYLS